MRPARRPSLRGAKPRSNQDLALGLGLPRCARNDESGPSSGDDATAALIAIGAVARIGRTPARLHPGGGGFVEASRDPIAERGPWRRTVIIMGRRVQLRNLGHLDLGRRRRRRQRRIESRAAGEAVRRLRVTSTRRKQHERHRDDRKSKPFRRSLRKSFHGGHVVILPPNGKRATLQARSRSDRSGRPRAQAGSTTAAYAAATVR
jgi:hypothetical protein